MLGGISKSKIATEEIKKLANSFKYEIANKLNRDDFIHFHPIEYATQVLIFHIFFKLISIDCCRNKLFH